MLTLPGDECISCQPQGRVLGVHLRYSPFDAGSEIPVPSVRHPHHELIYVERGDGQQHIGPELIHAQDGDAFMVGAGSFHRHADPSRMTTWSLCFRPQAVDGSIRQRVVSVLAADAVSIKVPEHERSRWEVRFRYLLDELNAHRGDDDGIVRSALKSVLLDVARLMRTKLTTDGCGRGRLLETVFRYIDEHYRDAISLRDVAAATHFSPAYLTDLVRRETGRPIHQWIGERRISAACLFLVETDLPIAAIAEAVGFRDPTYFGRHFSKVKGQTPRSYREARRLRGLPHSENGRTWDWGGTHAGLLDYVKLRTLAETLGSLRSREDIEKAVLDATYEMFHPSVAQVLQRVPAGISKVFLQFGSCDFSARFPVERDTEGVLPLVLSGQAVVGQDLPRSPLELLRRIGKLGFSCFMIAPIMIDSDCVGAIRILETKERAFSEHERSLCAMLSTVTGLALRGVPKVPA